MISKNNYTNFLNDFIKGNLSDELMDEFVNFLEANPEIEKQLSDVKLELSTSSSIHLESKYLLKKPEYFDDGTYFDQLCIAKIEGECSLNEWSELTEFIRNNDTNKKTLTIFKSTISKPDLSIVLADKNSLKRTTIVAGKKSRYKPWLYSAAASIVIFFTINIFIKTKHYSQNTISMQTINWKINKLHKKQVIQNIENSTLRIKNNSLKTNENSTIVAEITPKSLKHIELNHNIIFKNPCFIQHSLPSITNPENTTHTRNENFASIEEILKQQINSKLLKTEKDGKITWLSVSQAIVRGINKLSGKKIKFDAELDEQGKIQNLAFQSSKFDFELK